MKEEHLVGAASSVPQEVQKEVLKESVGGSVESDRLLVLPLLGPPEASKGERR